MPVNTAPGVVILNWTVGVGAKPNQSPDGTAVKTELLLLVLVGGMGICWVSPNEVKE